MNADVDNVVKLNLAASKSCLLIKENKVLFYFYNLSSLSPVLRQMEDQYPV